MGLDELYGDRATRKHNYGAGLLHGVFLQIAQAFSQPTTVLSAFTYALTGSEVLAGLILTLQIAGFTLPQFFAANFIEKRPRKKPYLILAISIRGLSIFLLGILTLFLGVSHPELLAYLLFFFLIIFFGMGGFGHVVYSTVIYKIITPRARGRFFGLRLLIGGAGGFLAGILTKKILESDQAFTFPENYGLIFLLATICLAIGFLGFYFIKERPEKHRTTNKSTLIYLRDSIHILKNNRYFALFIVVVLLLNGIFLSMSQYVVYAGKVLGVAASTVGIFVSLQVIGETLGGFTIGWLGDRFGTKITIILTGFLGTLIPIAALYSPEKFFPVVFLLVGVVFTGLIISTDNYLLEIAPRDIVPTCVAMKNTFTAPAIIMPVLGGYIFRELSFELLQYITLGLILPGLLLAFFLVEPRRTETSCIRKR